VSGPTTCQAIALVALILLTTSTEIPQAQGRPSGPAPAAAPLIDPVRLQQAHLRIVQASQRFGRQVPLVTLLRAAMPIAASGTVHPEDQRAAIVAATAYVTAWSLEPVAPDARDWPRAVRQSVTLAGRHDSAQHFLVSAAMAAVAGSSLADMIAVYKELRDASGGSGFSFSDVAANRAGQRFATLAVASPDSAARLLTRLHGRVTDRDLMPDVTGLPDGLSQQAFARRFGTVGSPSYNEIVAEIDRRIDQLLLFR
jgi:hypothetical protein